MNLYYQIINPECNQCLADLTNAYTCLLLSGYNYVILLISIFRYVCFENTCGHILISFWTCTSCIMSYQKFLLAVAVITLAEPVMTSDDFPNLCPQPTEAKPVPDAFYYGDPSDCGYFITCAHGKGTRMPCAPATVWSDAAITCVHKNQEFDTCSKSEAQMMCLEQNNKNMLIGHPKHCQRYYNCSKVEDEDFNTYLGRFEEECTYPDLFDDKENKCKPYDKASCKSGRVAAKDPCDYVQNMCEGMCTPCQINWPSCVKLPDGRHAHPNKPGSPYFIQCKAGRTMKIGMCGMDLTGRFYFFFSSKKSDCINPWKIARQDGGWAPSCNKTTDGVFTTEEKAFAYYRCPGGEVSFCDAGSIYNEKEKSCVKE